MAADSDPVPLSRVGRQQKRKKEKEITSFLVSAPPIGISSLWGTVRGANRKRKSRREGETTWRNRAKRNRFETCARENERGRTPRERFAYTASRLRDVSQFHRRGVKSSRPSALMKCRLYDDFSTILFVLFFSFFFPSYSKTLSRSAEGKRVARRGASSPIRIRGRSSSRWIESVVRRYEHKLNVNEYNYPARRNWNTRNSGLFGSGRNTVYPIASYRRTLRPSNTLLSIVRRSRKELDF